MLRNLCVATFALSLVRGAEANELTAVKPFLAVAEATSPGSAVNETRSLEDLYLLCSFYPKQGTCESVYRQAMKDTGIAAQAVRAEYMGYVRYLGGSETLTESDRHYLKENQITVPNYLSTANQAGLHNVINDATLTKDAKPAAINNFVGRAVQAELYCQVNRCESLRQETAKSG
jgi:hypothetical protein